MNANQHHDERLRELILTEYAYQHLQANRPYLNPNISRRQLVKEVADALTIFVNNLDEILERSCNCPYTYDSIAIEINDFACACLLNIYHELQDKNGLKLTGRNIHKIQNQLKKPIQITASVIYKNLHPDEKAH